MEVKSIYKYICTCKPREAKIIACLAVYGGMTAKAIAEETKINYSDVCKSLVNLIKIGCAKCEKNIYSVIIKDTDEVKTPTLQDAKIGKTPTLKDEVGKTPTLHDAIQMAVKFLQDYTIDKMDIFGKPSMTAVNLATKAKFIQMFTKYMNTEQTPKDSTQRCEVTKQMPTREELKAVFERERFTIIGLQRCFHGFLKSRKYTTFAMYAEENRKKYNVNMGTIPHRDKAKRKAQKWLDSYISTDYIK